ncbi:MAG: hypothetical protein HND52_17750 [Ignavibacteriae bacterium]|nr:hypothetical protein [Ignavibacteriota bacterium]
MNFRTLTFLIAIIFIYSCEDDPIGYLGLLDVDKPSVEIININNGDIISDSTSNIQTIVSVQEVFGIRTTSLFLNGELFSTSRGMKLTFEIPISNFNIDTNYIYATAHDRSGNEGKSKTIMFLFEKSIQVVNPLNDINLIDTSSTNSVNLLNVFHDNNSPNNPLNYEIISNSNEGLLDLYIENGRLFITPKKYLSGISTLEIKASANEHRFNVSEFNVTVNLAKEIVPVHLPDHNFRNGLISKYGFIDLGTDTIIQEQAQEMVDLELVDYSIGNPAGIEEFVNLKRLDLSRNNFTDIDLTNNLDLNFIRIDWSNLGQINISTLSKLDSLSIEFSSLMEIDLSNNTSLKYLKLSENQLSSLILKNNIELERLELATYSISNIDLSFNTKLKILGIGLCQINQLDLSQNVDLETLSLSTMPFSNIDVTNNKKLKSISILNTNVSLLDLSLNNMLETIRVLNNPNLSIVYVWQLPLPSYVKVYKDGHTELKLKPY